MNHSVKWQRVCLTVLCTVLALVLVILIFATTYVHHLLSLMGNVGPSEDTLSPEDLATATETIDPTYTGVVVNPTDVTLSTLPSVDVPVQGEEEVVNILLVGQDRKPGEPRQRADTMILITFNTAKDTITMTSFMRDTYVYIPDHGKNKLNAAYQFGGFSLLNETLAVNFGVHVDANVEVDFGNFKNIIDLLGGVELELTSGEAKYINRKMNSNRLSAGVQVLNGEEALWYARNRSTQTISGNKNDFGRTERQRRLLGALITAYKNQSLNNMVSLMYDILPMVTTNMTNNEILTYVGDLFPMLASAEINTLRIPADGTFTDQAISGVGQSLVPDLGANRDILQDLFELD